MTRSPADRPSLRAEQRAITRNRVIDAAVELFNSRSAVDVTMEEIAHAAGITRATVYAHFSRMSDIIEAIFDELHEKGDQVYSELAEIPEWTPESVRDWLDRISERWHREQPRVRLVNMPGMATQPGRYMQAHQRYVQRLATGPQWRGIDPAEAEQRSFMAVLQIQSFFNIWVGAEWPLRTANPVDLLADSILGILGPAVANSQRNRRHQ